MPKLTSFLALGALLTAQEPAGLEFFEKKIRPVLVNKCEPCHSGKLKEPMGGLRLDVPLESGRIKSRLLLAVSYTDHQLRMPPTGKLADDVIADLRHWIELGAPDPRSAVLSQPATGGIDLDKGRRFWAFVPPRMTEPPTGTMPNPIDRFLDARRREKGVRAAPLADGATWLRRVTFDLIGLPPTATEIEQFLADRSGQAHAKVLERLLESPRYGERWARHWLDLVRFAETNGHEFDNDKFDAWRYRDYVIRAFHQDVPYNQFVKEHIAGDLMPGKRVSPDRASWESPLGTSMFWFGEVLNSATDSVKSQADTVDNQIDVLGKAFLGLTLACSRCHDHKFDPISIRDYYALAGVMHSTGMIESVIDTPERERAVVKARDEIAAIQRRLGVARPRTAPFVPREGDITFEEFDRAAYDGWIVSGQAFGDTPHQGIADSSSGATNKLAGSLTSKKFTLPKLWVHIRMTGTPSEAGPRERMALRVTAVADAHKSIHFTPKPGQEGFHWVTQRMTKEIGRTCYFEIVDRSRDRYLAVDRIVLSDHDKPPEDAPEATPSLPAPNDGPEAPQLRARIAEIEAAFPESAWGMLSRDESPGNVRLHLRGNHKNLGDEVPRRFLEVIAGSGQQPLGKGSGRLELAEWIGSDKNPLTARVMVNRIWKHHFGQGLVRSADNFGKVGERPSHLELLDWLAHQFVASGWSVKTIHRLIVMSNAYGMSGTADAKALAADPRNELLHHMPVRRLEAESIRDAILAVAGSLDPTAFGPSVMPHISKHQDGRGKPESGPLDGGGRRSIYIQVRRNFLTPMFLAFDYPLPVSTIGTRGSSTVPTQALLMLNNEFIAGQARVWAGRMLREESDDSRRLDRMYLDAFGRKPESWERKETMTFVSQRSGAASAWIDLAHVLFNTAEFIYVR